MAKIVKDQWIHAGGSGMWTEFKNVKTGESTIKSLGKLSEMPKATHYDECNHDGHWQVLEGNNIQCGKCGVGRKIVWGIDIVRDGNLIHVAS